MSQLGQVLQGKRIVVCAGTGGVGKTTTSAALALGAARHGLRVLVLTIDPSRRLAETLGVRRNTPEPIRLGSRREVDAGITGPGALSAWMLDPKLVSDATVRRLAGTSAEADRLMANPIYQHVTQMIAGMQEYTAMEALHGFVEQGIYDLVILDTPPSRNALNFLEAPHRMAEFLDGRIFRMLLPKESGRVVGTPRKLVDMVLAGVFGEQFYGDLQVFFGAFSGMLAQLNGNAQRMRHRLQQDDVTFLLVTTPAPEALGEARFFEAKIHELELPLGAFILNRSQAPLANRPFPDEGLLPPGPTEHHRRALAKLVALAERERRQVEADVKLLSDLTSGSVGEVPAVALPEFGQGVEDIPGLASLSRWLLDDMDGA